MTNEELITARKEYTIHDILNAGYNLEPLTCLFCGSHEVTFLQYVGDASCGDCGRWQLEDAEPESFHTQGGGMVQYDTYQHEYIFVTDPPPGFEVGDFMPEQWSICPNNAF